MSKGVGIGIGIGTGFGGSGGQPKPVTDFFNGFELSGSTYSGDPTVVADNTGALVTSPAGVLPIEGMRLATTVADGAVLGPELIVNGDFSSSDGWTLSAGFVISSGVLTVTTAVSANAYRSGLGETGKRYQVSFSLLGITSGSLVPRLRGVNGTSRNTPGTYVEEIVAGGFNSFFGMHVVSSASGAVIDNFSVREVIPTWLPTTSLGAQIHPSTPLRTSKGTVSVYGEDFRGPLIEPARTNKVTCRKANPVDTTDITKAGDAASVLSVVDDVAALAAAGLDKICTSGKVYKLDNSAGSAQASCILSGTTSNLNQHIFTVYARVSGGTGIISDNTALTSNFTNTTYARLSLLCTLNASVTGGVRAAAGAIVYFILPQFEEGAFSTSPIALASDGSDPLTALTRPAANLTRPTAGTALESGNNFAIYGRVVPKASGQVFRDLLSSYVGAGNYTSVYTNSIADKVLFNKVGLNAFVETLYTPTANTPFEYLTYQHSVHGMGIAVRSWNGSAWSAWSAWATNANTQNAPIASTYQIGARADANHFAANYPFTEIIRLIPNLHPQTQLADLRAKGRI